MGEKPQIPLPSLAFLMVMSAIRLLRQYQKLRGIFSFCLFTVFDPDLSPLLTVYTSYPMSLLQHRLHPIPHSRYNSCI